jgi:glycosyltransferase involved in cell wall biosynthesis
VHVVIIASARYPLAEPFAGGLESLTWHLVRGLRDRGVEVTLFAGEGSDPTLGARELRVRPLALSRAASGDVSMPPEPWLREHHAYLQVVLELGRRSDIDVIHNNSLHHLPVALAAAVTAPTITTLHTPPIPWLESAIAVSDCDRSRFVAVSAHTARSWEHVVDADVVPNGVDVRRWWLPGPGGESLAWAGRLVPEKAPHLAIDIARSTGRPLRLSGPISDRAYFEAEVAPRLGDGVEYVGHLGVSGLAELFGSSAVTLVTPDWDEPYGLVAAESLACGTPVVAFDRGGLREFVTPEVGVVVPAGDVARAREAVAAAARLDRAACRAHAVTECSVDVMIERYVSAYTSMATLRGAA